MGKYARESRVDPVAEPVTYSPARKSSHAGKKRAAPCGAAEFREETSKKGSLATEATVLRVELAEPALDAAHLQVLLRLAELGSVQRTADTIGMTQSAVTQTLAYLENLLETRLFNRHARGVRPTAACLDLLPVARQVLQGLMEGAEVVVATPTPSVPPRVLNPS